LQIEDSDGVKMYYYVVRRVTQIRLSFYRLPVN
jgi:hypothetical protein